jgi:hypothetical protein
MPPGVGRMTLAKNQDRFRRPLVNEDDFPDPERLSSTSVPKKIRSREPSGLEGTRHRSRGFATDDPASDALSPLERSRAEELDLLS